ncbi:MAG: EAL domain-containing protein [Ferrovum myxofaciens]
MKTLKLVDCLLKDVPRRLDSERPEGSEGPFVAVFSESVSSGKFCGLASPADKAAHPGWIYADLVEHHTTHVLSFKSSVAHALREMDQWKVDALPVLDQKGGFIGLVTRNCILRALLQQESRLLRETHRLNQEIVHDKEELASWTFRLSSLHEASRTLLRVLSHTSLEADLLQHGIEALTQLLQARYGAIGIMDGKGELLSFHHTGMTEQQVADIGSFPEGRGLLGVVIREDTVLRLPELSRDPRSAGFPPGHPVMHSLLAVPISHGGKVYGRIYLCEKWQGKEFIEEDELLAKSFANSLSMVLENAREMREMQQAQQHLDYLAHFDVLTGLPNRGLIEDRLRQVLANSQRHGRKMALMFIDLDNFKGVNDTYGHAAGDELLKALAGVLMNALREGDTVARLGGDEFIILLPEVDSVQDVATVAEKIVVAVREPIRLPKSDHETCVTVSVGISMFPEDGHTPESLMSRADVAMYHAKSVGKNAFRFFTTSQNLAVQQRLRLEFHLRQALARGELFLEYQPQIDIQSGRIVGFEALLRWANEELGLVAPLEFIPVAEETGVIIPIGAWVLHRACRQAGEWRRQGYFLKVAVNVSAWQIHHDGEFFNTLKQCLTESGIPGEALELEITESLMIQKTEATLGLLEQIRGLGIRFAMDDFGTGYSSLSYLKQLPLAVVKIDREFICHIIHDPNDAAIVAAILAMTQHLGLRVVAEGVETQEQVDFLREHGCQEVQGYYYGPPVSASDFAASWLNFMLSGKYAAEM